MLTEKDIQTRIAEVLTESGFHVVASEVEEGFRKPAVFISVFPAGAKLLTCGGATEEVTDSVEIKYISAEETIEDCVTAADKLKRIFLYQPFCIADRKITIQEIEFEVEKTVLYVYFDLSFIQAVDRNESYEGMSELVIRGDV